MDRSLTQLDPLSFDKDSDSTIKILGLQSTVSDDNLDLEKRKIALLVSSVPRLSLWDNLLTKFSSLSKILRTCAYVLRFVSYVKDPKGFDKRSHVTLKELDRALLILVKESQKMSFAKELAELSKTTPNIRSLPKYIRKLTPFLDQDGILRVGGRLKNTPLSYDHKHPCLLPSDHRLTNLIIEYTHIKYLHPGLQTTQFLLSQRFWIPSSKRVIKKVLSSCLRCFKCNPSSCTPLMGDLPKFRVNKIKCFTKSECFPGADGVTRVVNVKTQKGILRRPVSKLCLLPNN
ncbi:hypothetical protein PPYR_14363 [Photinus pyralis]|uniref:Integrase zinc-binding domain-containing protein n=1 Tax=Photinus pyralis TaxID=7054 RepID=A0A5N4A4Z0_PHOPY|nr:hypothetical protein PPYR_14363 [Photinus pyralis]